MIAEPPPFFHNLDQTGALLDGHFQLRSGLHSRQFFQCALALQEMENVEQFGKALADQVRPFAPQTIVAVAMGGLVIGQEVARQFRCRFVFVEKSKSGNCLALRRGFSIKKDEKILIVEDVITRGGRVQETIDIIEKYEAQIVGIAVLVDRSGGNVQFDYPLKSLIQLNIETFHPDHLPEDLKAIPVVQPGKD